MSHFPSPGELAEESRRALAEMHMTPLERWEFMIQHGLIDRQGRVLCNRLFGGGPPANATPSDSNLNGPPKGALQS